MALSILPAAVGAGCGDSFGLCANEVMQVARSPDGRRDAVVFSRDCGATTALSTQVAIVGHGEWPRGVGTVLVADGRGDARTDALGRLEISVAWETPSALRVRYPAGARVFTRNARVEGIEIRYISP